MVAPFIGATSPKKGEIKSAEQNLSDGAFGR